LRADARNLLARPDPLRSARTTQGLRLYAANRPREALSLFEYVLSFNRKHRPTDAAALATTMNNVGAAYEKLGNAAVAITYFRAAIETLERSSLPNKEARIAHVTNRLAQLGVDANGASIPARAFTPPRVGAAPAAVQPACAERPAAHAGVGVATGERGPQNGCGASIAAMDARSQRAAAAASVASVGLSRDREVAE
jgi:tetratricopeptide (TPR) repeat protein